VCTAYETDVALLGGRRFWHYRRFVPGRDDAELFLAAHDAVAADHVPGGPGPVGTCMVVPPTAIAGLPADAVWSDTELRYAGYQATGEQVRVRYFDGAVIGEADPNRPTDFVSPESFAEMFPLDPAYSITTFADQTVVSADDVRALWDVEGLIDAETARRRVDEVLLVAVAPDNALAGVLTAYVHRSDQLRMDLWGLRQYVHPDHRRSAVGMHLLRTAVPLLQDRFVTGRETRCVGLYGALENVGLRHMFPLASGPFADFAFTGVNGLGSTEYALFFPGVSAPPP
jgi:GNAT superfamily N-acetyltransferase